jgi:hypothetical protein
MGLKLARGVLNYFFKTFKTKYHSFSSYVFCSFTSDIQRTFVTLQLVHSMTPKLFNLVNELEKY